MARDVTIDNQGSIVRVIPETQQAKDWIQENTDTESWQWFGNALCVEWRYADDLIAGMQAAGLAVGS
jgi:hypothetical protein